MNLHLLVRTEPLMQFLQARAQAEGMVIQSAIRRGSTEALAPRLEDIKAGLLIVEMTPDHEMADLQDLKLAEVASRPVRVILLSSHRSSEFLLAAMQQGVREVLPLPPSPAELASAFQRLSTPNHPLEAPALPPGTQGKIVTFMASKGGSGATFLASNMACIIAQQYERRCALLDLDLQYGDATFYLSDDASQNNISDVTKHIERLDAQLLLSSMHSVNARLSLLAAPKAPEAALAISASQLERVLALATSQYDWVVLDVARSLDALTIKALDMSDCIFMVMQNFMSSIRNAKRLVQIFRSLGYPDDKLRLVLNRHQTPMLLELPRITEIVGIKVRHTFPNHFSAVSQAINLGKPLAEISPGSPLLKSLNQAAAALLDRPAPAHQGWFPRLFSKTA